MPTKQELDERNQEITDWVKKYWTIFVVIVAVVTLIAVVLRLGGIL